jgi:hypothetical protein
VWEKDDELRKEGGGVGENGGLLMRGKGCWRLGGSVTEIFKKTREAAGGWLRLEDEGIKRDGKVEGLVCCGRLRGRRKTKRKKSWTRGEGDCWCCGRLSLPVFFLRPLCLSPSSFFSSPSSFYRQGKPCGDNGIRDKP